MHPISSQHSLRIAASPAYVARSTDRLAGYATNASPARSGGAGSANQPGTQFAADLIGPRPDVDLRGGRVHAPHYRQGR